MNSCGSQNTCGTLECIRRYQQFAVTPVAAAAIQLGILTPTPIATLPGGEIGRVMCAASSMASADSGTNQETFGTPDVWYRGTDDMLAMAVAMERSRQVSSALASATVLYNSAAAALLGTVNTLAANATNPAVLIPCVFGPNMWSVLTACGVTPWPINADAEGPLPGEIVLGAADARGRGYTVIGVVVQGGVCVPSGIIMSTGRRVAIMQDANTADVTLIEDGSGCYLLYNVNPDNEGVTYASLCSATNKYVAVGTTEALMAPSCAVAWACYSPNLATYVNDAALGAAVQCLKPTLLVQRATYLAILSLSGLCNTLPSINTLPSTPYHTTPPLPHCPSTRGKCGAGDANSGTCALPNICYAPASFFTLEAQIAIWLSFANTRWRFLSLYMARYMDVALRSFALAKANHLIDPATQLSTPQGGVWTWLYLPCGVDSMKVSCGAIRPLNQKCGVLAWPGCAFTCCISGEEQSVVPGMPLNIANQYCGCIDAVWSALGNGIAQARCAGMQHDNACSGCAFVTCVPPETAARLPTARPIPAIPLC